LIKDRAKGGGRVCHHLVEEPPVEYGLHDDDGDTKKGVKLKMMTTVTVGQKLKIGQVDIQKPENRNESKRGNTVGGETAGSLGPTEVKKGGFTQVG